MRSPKECWLTSPWAADFAQLAKSTALEPACLHALMQLQAELPANTSPNIPTTDPYIGLDSNAQMTGAKRVLAILIDLSTPIPEKKEPQSRTLNYARLDSSTT